MRKRKNDELNLTRPFLVMVITAGLIMLLGISSYELVTWIGRLAPTPVVFIPTPLPPTVVPTPEPPTRTPPNNAHFLVSTAVGNIFSNADTVSFTRLDVIGDQVAAAPGAHGNTLAYVRGDKLYLYRNEHETAVNILGTARLPAWNAAGNILYFILSDIEKPGIYQVSLNALDAPTLILADSAKIVAPPRLIPGTNRLLIVENDGSNQTGFYSCDVDLKEKDPLAQLVPRNVTWADYDPAQKLIVFSDDHNTLYLLHPTSEGTDQNPIDTSPQPILMDGVPKSAPAFSADGHWLAYIAAGKRLTVASFDDIENNLNQPLLVGTMESLIGLDWIN